MAQREVAKSSITSAARSRLARHQAQRQHTPTPQRGPRTRTADSSEDSLRESSEEVERPTAVFMAGGWGDVHDAASYAGVSADVLYREIRRGRLQAFKVGGRKLVRLKREHVDAYMFAQQIAVPVKL